MYLPQGPVCYRTRKAKVEYIYNSFFVCHGLSLHSRNATQITPLSVFRNSILH